MKWKSYGTRVEFKPGHSWYAFAIDEFCAQAICDAHNSITTALTAERDELKRKLQQMVDAMEAGVTIESEALVQAVRAIAEGREP